MVIVDQTCDLESLSASRVRTEEDASTTIVATDFWSRRRLRQAGLRYRTPIDYFDLDKAPAMDRLAVDAARQWYDAWADRLAYKGISLGRMAEYDFFSIFCVAFRCIDIAEDMIRREKPDVILLPPRNVSRRPVELCYEFLPEALERSARLNGIPTRRMTRWAAPGRGGLGRGVPIWRNLRGMLKGGLVRVRDMLEIGRVRLGRGNRQVVVFMTSASLRDQIGAWTNREDTVCTHMPVIDGLGGRNTRLRAELRAIWRELGQETAGRIVWDGVPVEPLVARYLEWFFLQRGPDLGEAIDWAHRVLWMMKPDMLVIMEDITPRNRAVTTVFRQVGLPVLVIQHGALLGEMGGFHVMPVEAQTQAVWGKFCRQWHVDRGVKEDALVVTGNPRFDTIRSRREGWRERICSELGIDPGRGLVLMATEWFSAGGARGTNEMEEDYIRLCLKGLSGRRDSQVVVKLHPAYQEKYEEMVRAIAEEEHAQIMVARDYLWDLIEMSQAVVIQNSTVGLEAMILGKPVIVVNPGGRARRSVYVREGAALEACNPEELVASLNQAIGDTEFRSHLLAVAERFVESYAYVQDGKASERVAALIAEILRDCRNRKTTESVPDLARR